MLAIPLVLLFESSLVIMRFLERKKATSESDGGISLR
jgi:Sec-independent protein secretion pathway component TatC